MSYLWIGISGAAAAVEILTLSAAAVWFIPAGIVAFFLSLFDISIFTQTVCFIIISLISVVLSKIILKIQKNFRKTGIHKILIGKTAIVLEEIDNEKNTGSVRINGAVWTARTEDGDLPYENGIVVTIIKIDGDCLICSR